MHRKVFHPICCTVFVLSDVNTNLFLESFSIMYQLFNFAPYSLRNALNQPAQQAKGNVIYPDFARHRRVLPAQPTAQTCEPTPLRRQIS